MHFDETLLTIDDNVFVFKAASGDTHLGGSDLVNKTVTHMMEVGKQKYNVEVARIKKARSRLRDDEERAKVALSTQENVKINDPNLFPWFNLSYTLSRAKFEELFSDL